MISEILAGLLCGLATAAVSEAVLCLGRSALRRSLFKALGTGAALRTLWVMALAGWALNSGVADPRLFVPALLLGYLAAQVFEGIRYTRYFEQC